MAVLKDNWKGHSYLNQKDYVKATTSKLFLFVFLPVYVDRHRGWMQRCLNACINQISTASRCWSFALRKSGRLGFKTVSSGSSDSWPAAGCCLNRFQPEAVNGFNDDVQRLLLCKSSDSFLYLSHLGQPINHFFSLRGLTAESECWRAFMASEIAFGPQWLRCFGSSRRATCCFFLRSMCHPQIAWFSQIRCVPLTFGSWGFVSCNFVFVFELWHFLRHFCC